MQPSCDKKWSKIDVPAIFWLLPWFTVLSLDYLFHSFSCSPPPLPRKAFEGLLHKCPASQGELLSLQSSDIATPPKALHTKIIEWLLLQLFVVE